MKHDYTELDSAIIAYITAGRAMLIDKSIRELIATANASGEGLVSVENVTLARMRLDDLIAAATADSRREGAEQMRKMCADYAINAGLWSLGEVIRALPLPTGPRKEVRLTDQEVRQIAQTTLYCGVHDRVRAIETAVLAANGMEPK